MGLLILYVQLHTICTPPSFSQICQDLTHKTPNPSHMKNPSHAHNCLAIHVTVQNADCKHASSSLIIPKHMHRLLKLHVYQIRSQIQIALGFYLIWNGLETRNLGFDQIIGADKFWLLLNGHNKNGLLKKKLVLQKYHKPENNL